MRSPEFLFFTSGKEPTDLINSSQREELGGLNSVFDKRKNKPTSILCLQGCDISSLVTRM